MLLFGTQRRRVYYKDYQIDIKNNRQFELNTIWLDSRKKVSLKEKVLILEAI